MSSDADERAPAPAASRTLKILVADDNVDFASSLAAMLTMLGHDVQVMNDGAAALRAASQDRPDVALRDIGMPELNGYDVARRLRAAPEMASVTLIAITGWGQASDKAAALDAGFDHHLVKPIGVDDLLALLPAMV